MPGAWLAHGPLSLPTRVRFPGEHVSCLPFQAHFLLLPLPSALEADSLDPRPGCLGLAESQRRRPGPHNNPSFRVSAPLSPAHRCVLSAYTQSQLCD